MIEEKTIKICGKEVKMRYCLAAEQGFEFLADKSINVFSPTVLERDESGKPTKIDLPTATNGDWVKLACAAIIAAYERINQDAPISINEIIYDATTKEIEELVAAIVELRMKWYNIPGIIKPETDPEEGAEEKNA